MVFSPVSASYTQAAAGGPGVPSPARAPYDNFEVPFSVASGTPSGGLERAFEGVRRTLNQTPTPLFDAFFSVENLDVIQNRLRGIIKTRSGVSIDRQSDTDLIVMMQAVFSGNANVGAPVSSEVRRLDDLVLEQAVPMVASGVTTYLLYLRDASRLPEPLPRGKQTSTKGSASLETFRGL